MAPTNLETLRVNEGMLAILLAGGIQPQTAAWAIDALSLYVAGYALETSMVQQRQKDPDATWVLTQDQLVDRFNALPQAAFPNTRRYATELTSGIGRQRFDFALALLIDNLVPQAPPASPPTPEPPGSTTPPETTDDSRSSPTGNRIHGRA